MHETIKAFLVLLLALAGAGLIWGFITQMVPNVPQSGILGFFLGGLILFLVYRWLVKLLKAPPA
jgi:hypothetical protein